MPAGGESGQRGAHPGAPGRERYGKNRDVWPPVRRNLAGSLAAESTQVSDILQRENAFFGSVSLHPGQPRGDQPPSSSGARQRRLAATFFHIHAATSGACASRSAVGTGMALPRPSPPSPPSPASSLAATTAIKGGRLNPSTAASRAVHRLSPASSRLSSPRPGRPGHPSPQRPSPTPAVERRCFHLGQVAAGGSPSPGGMTLPAGCGRGARGTATPRASRPDAACAPVWAEPRGEGRGHP